MPAGSPTSTLATGYQRSATAVTIARQQKRQRQQMPTQESLARSTALRHQAACWRHTSFGFQGHGGIDHERAQLYHLVKRARPVVASA
jgi:1-aminocyclopropane-1-carboxylate deaminase/D-cysteine desulfhydrase-like pyridoxal-dependent ACC family enzyme